MENLIIFANFFIDTEERFLRMKDSFLSFQDVLAKKWVINVRGKYALEVGEYLRNVLEDKLTLYHLNSKKGWFHDTRQMIGDIDSDYVMFWLEDHICMVNTHKIDDMVSEMKLYDIDYIYYSFWWDGKLRQRYKGIDLKNVQNFDYFTHNENNNKKIQGNAHEGVYIIAACSIFKTDLFQKIILSEDRERFKWPVETPFDFEKKPDDLQWLPLKVALPRFELFASIDDDHVHKGTSLISRGLYPNREHRHSYAINNHKKTIIDYLFNVLIKICPKRFK